MKTTITPIAHWHQTEKTVSIKLEIHNATDLNVECSDNTNLLITCDSSLRTEYTYKVELSLYDSVNTNSIKKTVKPLYVLITLDKTTSAEWPRLVQSSERNNKIKVNWDEQSLIDDTNDNKTDEPISDAQYVEMDYKNRVKQQNIKHFETVNKQDKHNAAKQYKTIYLLAYNIITLTCWLIVLLSQQMLLTVHGISSIVPVKFWQQQGNLAIACQLLSSIELLNIALKLIKGNIASSFMLHFGRNVILLLIYLFPEVQNTWPTFLLYIFWSIGDITRYTYYALSLVPALDGMDSSIFTNAIDRAKTLRVTVPLFVFPLGVLSEFGVLYNASQTSALNSTNIHLAMISYVLIAYGAGVPKLYSSMMKAYRNNKRSTTVHPHTQ